MKRLSWYSLALGRGGLLALASLLVLYVLGRLILG